MSRDSRLFDEAQDAERINLWDELSSYFRSASVLGRMEIGRRGEMLSMDYERDRLAAAGHCGQEPRWSALEDETLGYDITSIDVVSGAPVYIEVKTSERSPFVFFLTENEWNVAQRAKNSYIFHFWHLPTKRLDLVSVDEVASHIPINQGCGTWKKTQFLWPGY